EMLDQMSKMFIDLFQVADPNMDIRDQLKDNFGQRLFVRRYVSSDNLKTLGIYADLFKGSTRLNYNKVWIEFKWIDDDPYNLEKNTETLSMEIRMSTDIQFAPNEQFNLLSFMKLPTTLCGIKQKQYYSPYQLGFENKWAGVIDKLYLQHDIFNATPIIPSGIRYQTMYSGERDQVLVLNNVDVQNDQGIAFFAIRENLQPCGNTRLVEEKSIIPAPVTNVTASSWDKAPVRLDNRNYVVTYETSLTDTLQAYQTGNPTDLDLFSKGLQRKMYSSYLLNDYQTGNCKGEKPGIEMKEGGHPIFAFDISNFSQEDSAFRNKKNLALQTCWCEGAQGNGKGEYIEFTLTQPSNAVSIFNGNQRSNETFDGHTMADVIRFHSPDGLIEDKKYSIIDLSIKNLYPVYMPAGTYRIYLDDVSSKGTPTTCLSSILFDFVLEDDWYQKGVKMLEGAYKTNK
ncbi:MAG TPA: hypothetical protein PLI03_11640, partial [Chitinophagales bacterium]|nr:hypothetical protein [Chitinophagales bacterium]